MDKETARNQAATFARQNQNAMLMLYNADTDYIATRCCILNGLFSGFILASESIEKQLKALALFNKKKLSNSHDPFMLKKELQKEVLNKYKSLNKYDSLLKKLSDHYRSRYYDNDMKYETNGASAEELIEFDYLWFELKEMLDIPNIVKFRTKFFVDLFDHSEYSTDVFWITKDNKILQYKKKQLEKEFRDAMSLLY